MLRRELVPNQYDEEMVFPLAKYIVIQKYPDWQTEEAYEDHAYHDDVSRHSECVHCKLHWRFDGKGFCHAVISLALSIVTAENNDDQRV